jgi:hypothetical protein
MKCLKRAGYVLLVLVVLSIPDHTAILDAALNMGIGKSMSVSAFDSNAYARMMRPRTIARSIRGTLDEIACLLTMAATRAEGMRKFLRG